MANTKIMLLCSHSYILCIEQLCNICISIIFPTLSLNQVHILRKLQPLKYFIVFHCQKGVFFHIRKHCKMLQNCFSHIGTHAHKYTRTWVGVCMCVCTFICWIVEYKYLFRPSNLGRVITLALHHSVIFSSGELVFAILELKMTVILYNTKLWQILLWTEHTCSTSQKVLRE